jgi:hypothetical protein
MSLSLLLVFLQAAGTGQEPRWQDPSEVQRLDGLTDIYGPTQVFRTRSGHVGVVIYLQTDDQAQIALRISPGDRGPWIDAPLPAPWVRVLQVEGDEVELLGFQDNTPETLRSRVTLEGGRPRELWKKKFSPPKGWRLQDVAVDGHALRALLADEGDFTRLSFSQSTDDGATWTQPAIFGRTVHRGALHRSTELLRTEGAHHVVFLAEGGLVLQSSKDGGKTWTPSELKSAIPPDFGVPHSVVGMAEGRTIHLVVAAKVPKAAATILHVASRDDGATWEAAQPIMKGPIGGDLAPFYSLRGAGHLLAFTATDNDRARLQLSRDGGRTWTESDLREGIRGGTGLAATWVDPGGSLRTAMMVDQRKGRGAPANLQWVLLRVWDAPSAPPAPLEGEAREAALKMIQRLGDDDVAVREAAAAELRKLGAAAHLLFREELERTTDLHLKDSLRLLLPGPLRERWWAGSR